MSSKRASILSAVKTRLQGILTTGGYATNLGQKVTDWKITSWGPDDVPGVTFRDISNKREEPGLELDDVSADGSAAAAGLKRGDVILLWNEKPVDDTPTLMERLRDHEPGDVVKLKILREGKEIMIDVTLKASKSG